MSPQGRPAMRQLGRILDLVYDSVEILQKERPILLGQEFPTLQKPILQSHNPLHLGRGDTIRPRHPPELRGVRPRPTPQLLAHVPPPVQKPPPRNKRTNSEHGRERIHSLRSCHYSQPGHRTEGRETEEVSVETAGTPPLTS